MIDNFFQQPNLRPKSPYLYIILMPTSDPLRAALNFSLVKKRKISNYPRSFYFRQRCFQRIKFNLSCCITITFSSVRHSQQRRKNILSSSKDELRFKFINVFQSRDKRKRSPKNGKHTSQNQANVVENLIRRLKPVVDQVCPWT